ncbi:DUF4307 domain-containing protein [Actinocrinis puniceicyclus]|uniref:DUF4307 domain-containing protein n=1 Tax=Actinocrinis puniceicyclus TaxID=977794 RepID=A0A8J7WLT7_9ACTN|nr:DUF4307 domain-containing protein [Actinocrinis puniceicyclus]MBS2962472.1 DUF4307 domain-containing protein [Actinocrinis puniceicyclus]
MTDTIGSTPEPPRPQPSPRAQQRFRLPGEQAGAPRPAAARPGVTSTATSGTSMSARGDGSLRAMTPPEGRYGEKRGMSRPRKLGLAAAGLVLLGGVAGYVGWEMSHPPIQGTVTSFNASTTSVVVTFEVDKAQDKTATCTLVAVDQRGAVVGAASVPILSGRAKNVQTYTLQTTNTANTVTVQSCKLTS